MEFQSEGKEATDQELLHSGLLLPATEQLAPSSVGAEGFPLESDAFFDL